MEKRLGAKYSVAEVLKVLDELPSGDGESTDEESDDDLLDIDYDPEHEEELVQNNESNSADNRATTEVYLDPEEAGKHHQVYTDNYFTSIRLMEYLKVNGVDACGTIRSNRKALPAGMKADKELDRGEFDYMVSKQGIVYFKWNDNSTVHAVSNFHGTDASVIQRTQKDGTKSQFPCPTAIKAYNAYMGGVDKADMLCGIYGLDRKAQKWWHRIFFGIIDRTIVNAMVVYQKMQGESITTLQFRRSVAQSLITLSRKPKVGRPLQVSPLTMNKRRKIAYSVPKSIRLENRGAHWVVYDNKRGRCEVCAQAKVESRPHSQCSLCKVFLCSKRKTALSSFTNVTSAVGYIRCISRKGLVPEMLLINVFNVSYLETTRLY